MNGLANMHTYDSELSLINGNNTIVGKFRSSPALVLLLFYIFASIVFVHVSKIDIWIMLTIIIFVVVIYLLIYKPERLYSEKQLLEMKKLDLSLFGNMKNPQVKSTDYEELFQIAQTKTISKTKGVK